MLGKKIAKARKDRGKTLFELASEIGIGKSALSSIENDNLKGGPSPDLVVKIANALEDNTILLHYLEQNPVYKAVLPKIFPDLNNIRRDPAIIFTRIQAEMSEGAEAAAILAEMFSNADPTLTPGYEKVLAANLEQLVDVKRAIETLEFQLLASKVMTKEFLDGVYEQQQKKCEERGHHRTEVEEAV